MSVVVCDGPCRPDLHVHMAPPPSAASFLAREIELANWKARTRPLTGYEAWLWRTQERAAMRPAS